MPRFVRLCCCKMARWIVQCRLKRLQLIELKHFAACSVQLAAIAASRSALVNALLILSRWSWHPFGCSFAEHWWPNSRRALYKNCPSLVCRPSNSSHADQLFSFQQGMRHFKSFVHFWLGHFCLFHFDYFIKSFLSTSRVCKPMLRARWREPSWLFLLNPFSRWLTY